MPVIEYKFIINDVGKMQIPGYVEDRGHWYNSADHTYLGWVKPESEREFWVPDTIQEKTKAECVTRALAMHASSPMQKDDPDNEGQMIDMTDAEVTTQVEAWYDAFVTTNGG